MSGGAETPKPRGMPQLFPPPRHPRRLETALEAARRRQRLGFTPKRAAPPHPLDVSAGHRTGSTRDGGARARPSPPDTSGAPGHAGIPQHGTPRAGAEPHGTPSSAEQRVSPGCSTRGCWAPAPSPPAIARSSPQPAPVASPRPCGSSCLPLPSTPQNAPLFTSAEPSAAPGTSPQADALPLPARDAPDHQGGEREAYSTETPRPPSTTGISKTEAGQPLPALTPPPKAPQLCPLRQGGPGKPHTPRPADRSHAWVPSVPLEELPQFPPHRLDFASPFSRGQRREQTNSAQSCKARQRFWGANQGSGCGELGLWTRTGTLHPTPSSTGSATAPPEPHGTELAPARSRRPSARETRAQAPAQVPPRCHHLLLPSQPSPTPAGIGGFESPLCIPSPPDSHSSFPSSPEEPSPCQAAQGSVGLEQHLTPEGSPSGGEPAAGSGGDISAPAFAPLQLTGRRRGWRNFPPAHHHHPCSLVSKGNAAYAMSDACPSRPRELLDPPAAPSHHRARGRCLRDLGSPGAGDPGGGGGSAINHRPPR